LHGVLVTKRLYSESKTGSSYFSLRECCCCPDAILVDCSTNHTAQTMTALTTQKEQAHPAVLVQCSWLGMLTGVLYATWGCQASGEGLYTRQNKPLLQAGIKA
jgi:hypothetical protein